MELTKNEILKLAKEGRNIYDEKGNLIAGTVLISEIDSVTTADMDIVNIKSIHTGNKILHGDDVEYIVHSKRALGQSSEIALTSNGWNELFLRPTCENLYADLNEGAYLLWNVANVKVHKTLEADTIRISEESGFKYEGVIKYGLQRVPGSILQEDGSRIDLRDLKDPFEPVFVFTRKSTDKKGA